MNETIKISIMNPDAVVWQGEAEALSSENAKGPFDILPGHANFMTLIKDADIVAHLPDKQEETFRYDSSVLYFREDVAKIYIHT